MAGEGSDARFNPNAFPLICPATGAAVALDIVVGAFEFIGEIVGAWVTDQAGVASDPTDFDTFQVAYGATPTVAHSHSTATAALVAATPKKLTAAAGASRRPAAGDTFRCKINKAGAGKATAVNLVFFLQTMQSATDTATA